MIRRTVIAAIVALNSMCLDAQETKPVEQNQARAREFWLGIYGINPLNMSIGFKHQVSDKWFMSYNAFNLLYNSMSNGTSSSSPGTVNTNYQASGSVGIGIEKRHHITDNLTFFLGPNILAGYSKSTNNLSDISGSTLKNESTMYSAGIGYTFGALLNLKKGAFIALNVTPNVSYRYNFLKSTNSHTAYSQNSNADGIYFAAFNNPQFSIGYRF